MRTRAALTAVTLAGTVALSGCGLQAASQYTPASAPGTIEPLDGAEGVEIVVGAKNFTEQLILGKIAVIALQVAGFDVVDRTNIPGSVPARQGLVDGDIDMEWEYTGTAWLSYLGETETIPEPQAQYEAVRDADAANGLTWLPPAEANNTYAFAARTEALPELGGITTLSGLAQLPVEQRTLCVESEFFSRNDGLGPMLESYGVPLGDPQGVPRDNVRILDTGAVYTATDSGACNFGEVFATDGRIPANEMVVLEDDEAFFPIYNLALTVDTAVHDEHGEQLDAIFTPIAEQLDTETLQSLNSQVDVDGLLPEEVAQQWLEENGLIG